VKTERPAPDCVNCIHKETCDRAKEGTFCPKFASQQPPARPDPNKAWRTGAPWDE